MKKIIVSLFTVLLATTALIAQMDSVPNLMYYQTVIRDANGDLLVEKTIGVKVSILGKENNVPDGWAIYVEKHTVTTDANGVATINIGSGEVESGQYATLGEIDWSGMFTKWLRVEIDPTGGTNYSLISGESQLLTVPYAFHANSAKDAEFALSSNYADVAQAAYSLTGSVSVNKVGDLPLADVIVIIEETSDVQKYHKDAIKVEMIGKTFTIANATATQTPMKLLGYTPTYMWIKNNNAVIGENVYIMSVSLNGVDLNTYTYTPEIQETNVSAGFGTPLLIYYNDEIEENRYAVIDISSYKYKLPIYPKYKEGCFLVGPFLPNPTGGKNIIKVIVNQTAN